MRNVYQRILQPIDQGSVLETGAHSNVLPARNEIFCALILAHDKGSQLLACSLLRINVYELVLEDNLKLVPSTTCVWHFPSITISFWPLLPFNVVLPLFPDTACKFGRITDHER